MIEFKSILYPTDFSDTSLHALGYAKALAGQFDAKLHVIHIVDDAYQYWVGLGEPGVPAVVPTQEIWQVSQKQMEEFVARHLHDQKERLVTEMMAGRPFLEIIRYARKHSIDLIVIATHGRGGLASMLLGSVTEKVVRKAPCAVLTVRHPEHKFEMP